MTLHIGNDETARLVGELARLRDTNAEAAIHHLARAELDRLAIGQTEPADQIIQFAAFVRSATDRAFISAHLAFEERMTETLCNFFGKERKNDADKLTDLLGTAFSNERTKWFGGRPEPSLPARAPDLNSLVG